MSFINVRAKDKKFYAKINLELDSSKRYPQKQEVAGSDHDIAVLIGAFIAGLLDEGFDEKLLKASIESAFEVTEKEKRKQNINIKEIRLDAESEEALKDILNKIIGGEK